MKRQISTEVIVGFKKKNNGSVPIGKRYREARMKAALLGSCLLRQGGSKGTSYGFVPPNFKIFAVAQHYGSFTPDKNGGKEMTRKSRSSIWTKKDTFF